MEKLEQPQAVETRREPGRREPRCCAALLGYLSFDPHSFLSDS